MTATEIKRLAKSCGADLVGIAPMDRFEGAPMRIVLFPFRKKSSPKTVKGTLKRE